MLLEAIYHKPYSEYAHPVDNKTLLLRIRTKKNDIQKVSVYFYEKYDNSISDHKAMVKTASDKLFDYYEARIGSGIKRFKYMFCLEDRCQTIWYSANGFFEDKPEWGFFSYSCITEGDIPEFPGWLHKSILYQIFPDRFNNCSVTSNSSYSAGLPNSFFGGTLKGMTEKIGYLSELGINAVYLNPVFKSRSYHRYDTEDYYCIDPALGDKEDFKAFVDNCHQKGIKVIMDIVLNHCSSDFFAFKDVIEKGEHSPYKDWFVINSFPVTTYPKPNYECFGFFGGMPKLNTRNEELRKYLTEMVLYWIREFELDGLRFDTSDEIDMRFWRMLREEIKAVKPDTALIGEVWDEASQWLKGDQFDTCLNYPVKSFINDLIAYRSCNALQFSEKMNQYKMLFKHGVINNLINIIGTHDTPRFLTLCCNQKERMMLGILLQFTLPGVPMIYYGDETGMLGEGDPDCRKPMVWDDKKWDRSINAFYKTAIGLRKDHPALSEGGYENLSTGSEHILAYIRECSDEAVLVIINTGEEVNKGEIIIPKELSGKKTAQELVSGAREDIKEGRLAIRLVKFGWKLYQIY